MGLNIIAYSVSLFTEYLHIPNCASLLDMLVVDYEVCKMNTIPDVSGFVRNMILLLVLYIFISALYFLKINLFTWTIVLLYFTERYRWCVWWLGGVMCQLNAWAILVRTSFVSQYIYFFLINHNSDVNIIRIAVLLVLGPVLI